METKRLLLRWSISTRLHSFSSTSNYSSLFDLDHPSFPLAALRAQEMCWLVASTECLALPASFRQVKFTGGRQRVEGETRQYFCTASSHLFQSIALTQTAYFDNYSPVLNPSSRYSFSLDSDICNLSGYPISPKDKEAISLGSVSTSALPAAHLTSCLIIFVWSARSVFCLLWKL